MKKFMKWLIVFCVADLYYGHLFGVLHRYAPATLEAYFEEKDKLYKRIEDMIKKRLNVK